MNYEDFENIFTIKDFYPSTDYWRADADVNADADGDADADVDVNADVDADAYAEGAEDDVEFETSER